MQEHVSTLLGPEEVPALAHLINMPLTARELMQVTVDFQIVSFTKLVNRLLRCTSCVASGDY